MGLRFSCPRELGGRPVAIDEHGAPNGDDKGARDEIPDKPATASESNGVASGGRGGTGAEAESGDSGGPGATPPADGGEPSAGDRGGRGRVSGSASTVADAAEHGTGEAEDAEDAESFEPYLPPGPNPFSSVYPQGTPPYLRPAGGEPVASGPAGSAGSGPSYPPSRDARPAGRSGYPEQPPYPELADGDPAGGYPAQEMYGKVSAYPAYQPYGYDLDDEAGYPQDALEDYGEASLSGGGPGEGYGYASAPTAEPLPGISASGEAYPAMAMQGYGAGRSLSSLARGGSQHGHEDG